MFGFKELGTGCLFGGRSTLKEGCVGVGKFVVVCFVQPAIRWGKLRWFCEG